MRWMILAILLIGCAGPLEKIGEVYVPQQYAVTTTIQGNEVSYVVRNGEYVACEGTINGRKCTTADLQQHGKTVQDMLGEISEWEDPVQEPGCFADATRRVCLDKLNAITSYSDGTALWEIQYVK